MKLSEEECAKVAKFLEWSRVDHYGRESDKWFCLDNARRKFIMSDADLMLACMNRTVELGKFIQVERWIQDHPWVCLIYYPTVSNSVIGTGEYAPISVVHAVIQLPEAQ